MKLLLLFFLFINVFARDLNISLQKKLIENSTFLGISLQHTTFEDILKKYNTSFQFFKLKNQLIEGFNKEKLLCFYIENKDSYVLFKSSKIPGDFKEIDSYLVQKEKPKHVLNLNCHIHKEKSYKIFYLGLSFEEIIKVFGESYIEGQNIENEKYILFQVEEPSFIKSFNGQKVSSNFEIPIVRSIEFYFRKGKVYKYNFRYRIES